MVLTLPLAGVLKKRFPDAQVLFLGSSYTRDVVNSCEYVDAFIDWDAIKAYPEKSLDAFKALNADVIIHVFPVKAIARLAKKARIPYRIGTTNRLWHWTTCNRLVRLSRKKSNLHEAQLNLKLAEILTGPADISPEIISNLYGMTKLPLLPESLKDQLSDNLFNIILHPKSKGSAREWGLENFSQLIDLLPEDEFRVFITGTSEEGRMLQEKGFFDRNPEAINLTGKMTLKELIAFIGQADGLVAASTGPLHIAAALGKKVAGIYPPIRPMHPGRWAPLGENANYIVLHKTCDKCRKSGSCSCIESIAPVDVYELLLN